MPCTIHNMEGVSPHPLAKAANSVLCDIILRMACSQDPQTPPFGADWFPP